MSQILKSTTFLTKGHETFLAKLIHRLEVATSRIEDIASAAQSSQPFDQAKDALQSPNERPTSNGESKPLHPPVDSVVLPAAVLAFDTMLQDDLKPFADLSEQLGGLVAEQVRRDDVMLFLV